MFSWIGALLGIVPAITGTINGITNAISNERIKAMDATTEQERISAQERVNSLQAKRDVLIAESGRSSFNAYMRGAIGASVAVIIAKLLVWDKAIGSIMGCSGPQGSALECSIFRTDVIDGNLWSVIMAAIGFYFVYEASVNTARIIKS